MAKTVTAKEGDSLCNIAFQNGFGDCTALRDEPKNKFILDRTGDEKAQLRTGDKVTVPKMEIKDVNGATEQRHKFVKRGTLAILRFVHGAKDTSFKNDRTLTFLNVSNFITNQAGPPDGNVAFPGSGVRDFNENADKDKDAFKVEVLDINGSGELEVELEVLKPVYDAKGKVTKHEQFPAAIRAPRQIKPDPKASKQGATQRFRTCYLRLVVDDEDKKSPNDQTLLTSDMFDAADAESKKVEILDQKVKGSYIIKTCPKDPKCRSTVILPIGEDRRRIRLAVHVLNNKVTGADKKPVVKLEDAEKRVLTWFRRVYAQANIAPKLTMAVRAVDPPANLVAISNDSGLPARGDGQIGFTIHVDGKPDVVIGPITPKRNDKPIKTARALAKLVKAPFKAAVSENPARFVDDPKLKSADIVITEDSKARVTITIDILPPNRDTRQTIVARIVNPMNLESWAVPNGNDNWNAGSYEQRAVLKNFDTKVKSADDTVDIFVVDQLTGGNRGEAMMSNHRVDPLRSSITQVKFSAFLTKRTMDETNNNPFSFPHEVTHVTAEVVHCTEPAQLMFSKSTPPPAGTSGTNAVGGTKRIRDAAVTYDTPVGNFNIVSRLRTEGKSLLESW
ncbi:hypothetical protein BH10ACI1_BH10ACI1_07810 [soil metagenome]